MKKIWEGLGLLLVLSIVFTVASDAIQPYMPIIGISLSILVVLAVGVLLFRLLFRNKTRNW